MIDLRATGVLRAIGHDPTLVAHPEPLSLEIGEGDVETEVRVRFRTGGIEVPGDLSALERIQMLDNLRSKEVLDAKRFPIIEFRGRYAGSSGAGVLRGDLILLGLAKPIEMEVRVETLASTRRATGTWEGNLKQLGIRPFSALFGALKLEDWIRLRLEAVFQ